MQDGSERMSGRGWRTGERIVRDELSALWLEQAEKVQHDNAHLELDEALCDWDRLSEESSACSMRQAHAGTSVSGRFCSLTVSAFLAADRKREKELQD